MSTAATLSSVPTAMAVRAMRKSISENFGSSSVRRLSHPAHRFSLSSVADLTDKVAVVTGGADGLGYAAAHTLLEHNVARVHLLVPSFDAAMGAMADLQTDLGSELADRVTLHQVDLGDWNSAWATASNIAASEPRLDMVLCNATLGAAPPQLDPRSGIDSHMAANHFGHVVLVTALLPALKRAAEDGDTVRIVTQAADAHAAVEDPTCFASPAALDADLGSPALQYGRSKLAAILLARYWARHLTLEACPNILANVAHPGPVDRDDGLPLERGQWDAAASPTLFALTATERSGEYICPPGHPFKGTDLARDSQLGEELMRTTRQVLCEKLGTEDWWDH